MMEGIFICAAPHCLKSFLKKSDFESHIYEGHPDLLQPNAGKEDGNESESQSNKQPAASESSVRAPSRPVFSPNSTPHLNDREEKSRRQQPREQQTPRGIMQQKPPPIFGQVPNFQPDSQPDSSHPPGFERPVSHSRFPQNFDAQGNSQDSSQQQGHVAEGQFPDYPPVHSMQPPNFAVPMNSTPMMTPPFGVPPFPTEGSQQFYGAPYGMPRPDSLPEVGGEQQASLLGFPPGPGGVNYPANFPQMWNATPNGVPYEVPTGGQGMAEGFTNYQGYAQNPGGMPMVPPHMQAAGNNKGMESMQAGNAMDPRDGKGILAPPAMSSLPPPPPGPPPQPHMPPQKRGKYYSNEGQGQGYGWAQESRDSFGNSQD